MNSRSTFRQLYSPKIQQYIHVGTVITFKRFLFIFVNLIYYCSYYSVLSHFFPSERNILFPNLFFFSARSLYSLSLISHSSLLAIFFRASLSASVQPSKSQLKVFFNWSRVYLYCSCSLVFILHNSLVAIFFSASLAASVQPSKSQLKVFFT